MSKTSIALKHALLIGSLSVISLTGCVHATATPEKSTAITTASDNTGRQIPRAPDSNFQVSVVKDIAYGDDSRQRLDIYSPNDGQHHPVIIFAYGGAWHFGSRHEFGFIGKQFAKAGYTTVVIDYRHAPKHVYPDYVEDTAHSIGWVYRNIDKYNGIADQLFVMGHSAGAFNITAAIDDARYWQLAAVPDKAILGVIGLAGPYSYDYRKDWTRSAFPKASTPDQVMPAQHIRAGVPPHLLLVGIKDHIAKPFNADRMQLALQQKGANVERVNITTGHIGMIMGLSKTLQPHYPTYNIILDYLKRQLNNNAAIK